MKYLKGYVKSSLKYIFIPTHIVVGIIGVVGAYYFSLFQMMSIEGSVLDVFVSSLYFIPFILALTFAAIPYVGVICEELENGYIYLCILRGDLRAYVISRVLGIEISAIITILIGSFIFILSVKYRLPWVDTNSVIYQTILEQGCFQEILKNNQYVLYFLLYSFKIGLLTANISSVALFLSLFWSNKFFVFSIPFLFYYFQVYVLNASFANLSSINLMNLYNSYYRIGDNDISSFLAAIFVNVIFLVLCGIGCFWKLNRRIQNNEK